MLKTVIDVVFGSLVVLAFIFVLSQIMGCSTVNIDCFKEENKESIYCLERKYQRMERPFGGRHL